MHQRRVRVLAAGFSRGPAIAELYLSKYRILDAFAAGKTGIFIGALFVGEISER